MTATKFQVLTEHRYNEKADGRPSAFFIKTSKQS
jgi:hypothetical protein